MTQVITFDEVKSVQNRSRSGGLTTRFLVPDPTKPDEPNALISHGDPGRSIVPHFHIADQFQLVAGGKGFLGRHEVEPYAVHFTRAYTPYGPLKDDGTSGIVFYTLRARFDPGAQYLPESREKLMQTKNRRPWQISSRAIFPESTDSATLIEVPNVKDDEGLAAYSLMLAPKHKFMAPSPAHGDGQYIIVVKGSVQHEGVEKQAPVVIFLKPSDESFQAEAGGEGLQAVIMNFPRLASQPRVEQKAASGSRQMQCALCDFVYDEKEGSPHDGIKAGTKWEDVPDDGTCPDCAAGKTDFHEA